MPDIVQAAHLPMMAPILRRLEGLVAQYAAAVSQGNCTEMASRLQDLEPLVAELQEVGIPLS